MLLHEKVCFGLIQLSESTLMTLTGDKEDRKSVPNTEMLVYDEI